MLADSLACCLASLNLSETERVSCVCFRRGSVHSVRSFGLLVSVPGTKRHGLVYHTQVSDGIAFDRDDNDDSKIKALNYYFPVGKEVRACSHCEAQATCNGSDILQPACVIVKVREACMPPTHLSPISFWGMQAGETFTFGQQ